MARIGDLRFSLLKPVDFLRVYGDDWVLCDGQTAMPQRLAGLTDLSQVPDARGMFLRAMNHEGGSDPQPGRIAGDAPQADDVIAHTHSYKPFSVFRGGEQTNGVEFNATAGSLVEGVGERESSYFPSSPNPPDDHSETRPKNIAAYLYLKIR